MHHPARHVFLGTLLTCSLILLQWLTPGAHATYVPPAAGTTTTAASTTATPRQELVARRTATSRTYLQGDTYTTDIYSSAINYWDGAAWQPIDDTLEPATQAGFAYQTTANSVTALFPRTLASGPIRIQSADGWVAFSPVGGTGEGTVSGSSISYPVGNNTLALTAVGQELKETVTLQDATTSSISFALTASSGLSLQQQGTAIAVLKGNTPVFSLLAPTVMDAAGVPGQVSFALTPSLTGWTLTEQVDPTWLRDPSRLFPVTVDPTITITAIQNKSCSLYSAYVDQSYCNSGYITVGTYPATDAYRGLLQFDLSSVPQNILLQQATFGLYQESSLTSRTFPVSIHHLTHSWTTSATWRSYDYQHPWTTPGGDFVSTPDAETLSVGSATNASWVLWHPTSLVKGWLSGTIPNDGLLVKSEDESNLNYNYVRFQTASSPINLQPYLQLTYTPAVQGDMPGSPAFSQSLDDSLGLAVNLATGTLLVQHHSDARPEVGLPVGVDEIYDSSRPQIGGAATSGWATVVGGDIGLTLDGYGNAFYQTPGGTVFPFMANGSGYTTPPGIDADLVHNQDGTYSLTAHGSQEVLHFSSTGQLLTDTDRSGNHLSYTYSNGALSAVTGTDGSTTTVSYSNGLPSQVADPAGHSTSYQHNPDATLASITDPAGQTTAFTYSTGLLTQITDPDGNLTTIRYDSSNRVTAITRITNPSSMTGNTWTISYGSGTATVTDPNNHTTTSAYDAQQRLTRTTYPDGTGSSQSWTGDDQVASQTTPQGQTTSYTYDTNNNLTQVKSPSGITTSWAYGNTNNAGLYQPTSATDTQGNTSTFAYDSLGRLDQVTDPAGKSQSVTYNSNGTVASETDENGHTTTHTYTSTGLPLQDTPPCPDGSTTRPCASSPTPLGITQYSFNTANLESAVTDGDGQVTSYSYDNDGRVTGNAYADHTAIGYSYDADGNLLAMTDSTGTTTYSYNNLSELVKKTLPGGQTVTYTYDAAGNLTSQTDRAGTTSYAYDQNDELSTLTDRQNQTYTFGYDQNGDRTSVLFPNGVTESLAFDQDGKLTSVGAKTSGGSTLSSFGYQYTKALPSSVTDTAGNTTSYSYDSSNQLTGALQRNSAGSQLASYGYGYDDAGNLTSKAINGTSTTFTYNANNEVTGTSTHVTYTYDGNGDRTSVSDGTHINLNASGQITSITPHGSSTPIPYTYTGQGEQERIGNGSTTYQYDGTGLALQSDSTGTTSFTETRDLELRTSTMVDETR